MNNKKLGASFEREFCELLASKGWWVHFITPAPNGGQPFDIIAVKGGSAMAFDCKTSATHIFPLTRLEENQIMAFERWLACGNEEPQVAVKYNDNIYLIPYRKLKQHGRVDLDKESAEMATGGKNEKQSV